MKKIIILSSLFFVVVSSQAQQIQWASKVIKFSSDLGGKQNGIKRILGKPDSFPQGGSSPNAWVPKNALDGREVIELGFDKPQMVKQVAVFENLNAGCVVKISADNGSGKYETVWTRRADYKTPKYKTTLTTDRSYYFKRKRRKIQEAPDLINPGIEYAILDNVVSNVVAVKVEFNFAILPGQKQIDAIGISDSEVPIEANINAKSIFENLPNPENILIGDLQPQSPIVSQNGNMLYFTNDASDKEEIYSCSKTTGGKWGQPILENSLNESEGYNYLEFAGADFMLRGGGLYSKGSNDSGFAILNNTNGKYENSGQLKIAAYNNYDDNADATISNDRKTLILSIETDFSQGGTDLYFANRKDDGTYSMLQNMGKIINSAADESSPQLLSDNKTLLFSSLGFSSFGNYDIYVSYRLDDTWKKWSEPVNLGNKINGNDYEGSPFYDEITEMLYFIRATEGKTSLVTVKIPKEDLTKN